VTRTTRLRALSVLAAAAWAAGLLGCGPSEEAKAADRAEIERVVARYAELLAQCYRDGDASPLAEIATEREVERVASRIRELEETGKALRPVLRSQVVEQVDAFSGATAGATTIEVWDLRSVALGSEETLGESNGQENRIVYTLHKERGRWQVLARLMKSTSEPS